MFVNVRAGAVAGVQSQGCWCSDGASPIAQRSSTLESKRCAFETKSFYGIKTC